MGINDGLWGWWKADGSVGSTPDTLADSSGYGRTLVYYPHVTYPDRDPAALMNGKIAQAVQVRYIYADDSYDDEGVYRYIIPPAALIPETSGYTIAAWIQVHNNKNQARELWLITGLSGTNVYGGIYVRRGNVPIEQDWDLVYGTPYGEIMTVSECIPSDEWHLVVASYNPALSSYYLWLDNVLVASKPYVNPNPVRYHVLGRVQICRGPTHQVIGDWDYWAAYDDIRIWTRALDSGERDSIWNGGGGFDPIGSGGVYAASLVYAKDLMEGRRGWFYDTYTPSLRCHYGEEGANVHSILCGGKNGGIYQLTGTADDLEDIACQITTESRDQGDPRHQKLYGDIMLDCDTGSVDVTATPKFNNDSVASTPVTVNTSTRTQVPIPVGTEWQTARNISLDLQWDFNGEKSYFYIWEPRYTEETGKIYAYDWETSFLTHEMPGYFYHGYLYLVHVSTANLTFTITDEDGTVKTTTTIAHSAGLHRKDFIRLPVIKGKMFKYRLASTAQFRIVGQESELLVKPWGMGGAWQRQRIFQDIPHGEAP